MRLRSALRWQHLFALCFLGWLAIPAMAQDSYNGYDLDKLAKAMAEQSRFTSEYAPGEANSKFDTYLRQEMDSSRSEFFEAYGSWWDRFRADETGRLEARFHTLNSKYTQENMFGDVPDQSQETKEGVTLDTYAKIVVALSRQPGADLDAIARQNGLDGKEHFDRVNKAWGQAMAADSNHTLTQQYGALYQKHAGAGYAAEQEEKLAKRNEEEPAAPAKRPEPPSAADYATELESPVPHDRWYAARQLLFQCTRYKTFGDKVGPELAQYCSASAVKRDIFPVVAELEAGFDHRDAGLASGIIGLIRDLELQRSFGRDKVESALKRAKGQLAAVRAEYDPIRDKAVPQKTVLRSQINSYETTIREFERHLAAW